MKRGSRAWLVAVCATGVNLSLGMLNGWSVFAAALVQELGFSKTEALLPYTVAFITMSFLMILGGGLQDRYGPRLCVTTGGIMAGAGMIVASFAASLPVFVLSFGFLTGAGIGIGHAATIPAAARWFPQEMRGRVSGLVVAGVGLSAVYVAPLTHALVTAFGVKRAFWLEGLFFSGCSSCSGSVFIGASGPKPRE